MSTNEKDLDREEMLRLLSRLEQVLRDRGQKVRLYVIGGANMAIAVNESRTTKDIDAVINEGDDALRAAAEEVARTEPGLGPDWINSEFTGFYGNRGGITWQWFDNRDSDEPTTLLATRSLEVELASPEMMLALKSIAGRPQDREDAFQLMRLTGITTPKAMSDNLTTFTGERVWIAQNTPGMILHIDPGFHFIFDNLPDDLRAAYSQAEFRERGQCGYRLIDPQTGETFGYCRRKAGHSGKHRSGLFR